MPWQKSCPPGFNRLGNSLATEKKSQTINSQPSQKVSLATAPFSSRGLPSRDLKSERLKERKKVYGGGIHSSQKVKK